MIFETKPNTITLSGNELPFKCDNIVLEQLQEMYGDVFLYEEKLLGAYTEENKKGENVTRYSGKPDTKAINDGLYLMVCEGLDIAGEEPIDRKTLIRMIDMHPVELTKVLHDEFMTCFERKNAKTMQSQKTKTAAK